MITSQSSMTIILKSFKEEFKRKNEIQLALDGGDNLTYIAPTMVNLNLTQERYPDVQFRKTREH